MDDQPNPLSLPEAPARRRANRADRPDIQAPPRPPVLPDSDEWHRGRGPGEPPPPHSRLRTVLRYGILLLVVAALVLWLVFRSGPQAPTTGRLQSGGPTPVGTAAVEKGEIALGAGGV